MTFIALGKRNATTDAASGEIHERSGWLSRVCRDNDQQKRLEVVCLFGPDYGLVNGVQKMD
jgi:hypothetical protein